ncbi:MAG: hypothetical protein SFV18_11565 [Bryobacteraceae bacterium]|nr:hypothetical protein [Bryobacteraceae bacterium]
MIATMLLIAADLPSQAVIDRTASDLAAITGFRLKRRVRVSKLTREDLERDLNTRVAKKIDPKEIRADELTLQWLGFAAPGFDLKKTSVDLIAEQAAAYYDYKRKKLVLLENPIGEFDESLLAHELAHALADQTFRIGRYMDRGEGDDAELARQAVVEGQATWLMTEFGLRREGRSLKDSPFELPPGRSTDAKVAARFPVLEKSPLYLRVNLLFPYWEGARFQQAVFERLGAVGFKTVFKTPPVSSRQIMHPETYFAREVPEVAELPAADTKGWNLLNSGSLGEIDHLIAFKQNNEEDAENLAAAWRGGSYEVRERGSVCCLVRYASIWKDEPSAASAQAAWERHLKAKPVRGTLTVTRAGRTITAVERPETGTR